MLTWNFKRITGCRDLTVFIYRRKISKQPSLLHVNVEGFFCI
nr:MAG TPA: hypothetical protein [Caudoviricetes sp.]